MSTHSLGHLAIASYIGRSDYDLCIRHYGTLGIVGGSTHHPSIHCFESVVRNECYRRHYGALSIVCGSTYHQSIHCFESIVRNKLPLPPMPAAATTIAATSTLEPTVIPHYIVMPNATLRISAPQRQHNNQNDFMAMANDDTQQCHENTR